MLLLEDDVVSWLEAPLPFSLILTPINKHTNQPRFVLFFLFIKNQLHGEPGHALLPPDHLLCKIERSGFHELNKKGNSLGKASEASVLFLWVRCRTSGRALTSSPVQQLPMAAGKHAGGPRSFLGSEASLLLRGQASRGAPRGHQDELF